MSSEFHWLNIELGREAGGHLVRRHTAQLLSSGDLLFGFWSDLGVHSLLVLHGNCRRWKQNYFWKELTRTWLRFCGIEGDSDILTADVGRTEKHYNGFHRWKTYLIKYLRTWPTCPGLRTASHPLWPPRSPSLPGAAIQTHYKYASWKSNFLWEG